MKNNYKLKTSLAILVGCFMMVFSFVSKAQIISAYTFVETTEVYTPVVGTNSTAVGDDGSQNAIPLGFTFNFGGTNYTTFSVNTNGFIRLGANIAATSFANNIATASTQNPLIAALWDDNNRNAGSIQYSLTGATPNQILEIGWDGINIGGGGSTSGTNVASFKMRLYETTNVIEIIYDGTMNTAGTLSASIGLSSTGGFHSATPGGGSTSSTVTANDAIAATGSLLGKKFVYSPPPPCSGTPTAGTTAGPTGACAGVNFLLSLTGASTETGLTYQWQSSPDNVTYTNIGSTSSTATVSQTVATYYQCIVTCTASGMSATSTFLLVNMNAPTSCYCAAAAGGTTFEYIGGVVATGGINNTGTAHSTYTNYSATQISTVYQGQIMTVVVSSGATWYATDAAYVFIDFNQDGDFNDVGELAGTGTGATSPYSINITVPLGATLGNTGMRIKFGDTDASATVPMTNSPCQVGYTYGETEDYGIVITLPPACPAPTALTVTGITTTTANLAWTCTACTGTFALEWGPTGFTPGTGTIVNPATSPVPVTGLTPATGYQFYVIQDCSGAGDGFSLLSGPFSFTTLMLGDDVCDALPLAFGTNGPYNNTGTTVQTGEPAPAGGVCNSQTAWCNNILERTLWFSFVAPASGRVSITSPGFDTQLALWSAANCGAILAGGATLVAANDDGGPSFSSVLTPVNCLTPGTTYFVQLDGFNGAVGSTTIVLTDLGAADPSFTGLSATACDNGTAQTLTPTVTGGVFAGTGVTGSSFDPTTAGAGTYSVTYTLNGCYTSTQSVTVNAAPVATSVITSPVLCNGGNATVTVSATGGTPSYTGTGAQTPVAAGPYSYTVTDANSCSSTTTGTITEPTVLAATTSSTSILCNGGTATVTVVATGGTPSYTGTGAFPQSSGMTVYTVTDANGCIATTSATLTEPTAIVVSSSETGVLCNGGTSTVTISATGGTPTYGGVGSFTQSAGTITYTVTDANGCTSLLPVTVAEPTALVVTSSSTAILCNGGSSTVTVAATGGTTPYTGDGSFTQLAGTTVYTVTDANGCITTTSQTITEPTAVMVMFTSSPILCNGGTSSVVITAMDGTPAYTGEGTFTQSAGTTVYTVTDANSCVGTASVVVTEPAAIATAQTVNFCGSGSVTVGTSTYTAAGTYTDVLTAASSCDSTVTTTVTITTVDATTSVAGAAITANSATGTYLWLDCNAAYAALTPSETNQVYNSTANGSYAVQVTDNGCVDTSACVVISTTGIENNGANVLSVYPNPTMGMFNIVIANANIAELVITIVDIQGKEVFSSVDKNVNGSYNKQINLEEISKGLYYIKMNTGAEVKIQKLIVQ